MEVVWHGFLRKTVRGGYNHKNALDRGKSKKEKDKDPERGETVDWSFDISNEQLHYITGTSDS